MAGLEAEHVPVSAAAMMKAVLPAASGGALSASLHAAATNHEA